MLDAALPPMIALPILSHSELMKFFSPRHPFGLVVLLVAGCSSATSDATSPSVSESNETPSSSVEVDAVLQDLSVSIGDLVPAFEPTTTEYTLTANTSLVPIDVRSRADSTLAVTVNGVGSTNDVPATVTLSPRQDLVVSVRSSGGAVKTYTVHYLPATLPAYSVAALDTTKAGDEVLFLTPANQWLLAVDRAGEPLYYRSLAPLVVTDFKRQTLGDRHVYSFLSSDGATDGRVHLLDDHFRDLTTLKLLPNRDHDTLSSDNHEFLVLGEDHYVMMAYETKILDLSGLNALWGSAKSVVAGVIQEVDRGAVVFEWDSTDVPSLYDDSVEGNSFATDGTADYVHMNSVQVDPTDGNFIVSLRHTNSVIKLDRTTGATIWTLGGRSDDFGLTTEQLFSHQHYARKSNDGHLTLFDNGNNAHPTRVLTFALDEANKTATSYDVVYERPADQIDSTFMGSALRMTPTRYVIGWGGRTDLSKVGPAVTEVVDGTPVWSLTFAAPDTFSYRAAAFDAP